METTEILRQFERFKGKFAGKAVEAAIERRQEITPELLRILEETVNQAAQLSLRTLWTLLRELSSRLEELSAV